MADVRVWRLGKEQHLKIALLCLHIAQQDEAFLCMLLGSAKEGAVR